jgi:hypothetical protein
MSKHQRVLCFFGLSLFMCAPAETVEQRAAAVTAKVAKDTGWTALESVTCRRWRGSYLCDLCYNGHPDHLLGYARIWCNSQRCEWILDADDPRNQDSIPDRCFVGVGTIPYVF